MDNDIVGALSIVKNNGGIEIIEKNESFTYDRMSVLMRRASKNVETNNESYYDNLVTKALEKADKEGLIKWTKK